MHSDDIQAVIDQLELIWKQNTEVFHNEDAGAYLDECIEDLKDQKIKKQLIEAETSRYEALAYQGDMNRKTAKVEASWN